LLTSLIAGALAHDNGMDMNIDQGMSTATNIGNTIMYLYFTIGDNLWFLGWAPSTGEAMAGGCVGLAIAQRWLIVMQGVMEEY
ncbi:hypothetical protein DFH94DRAFT_621165, partial [Russula ochroleuca]